ncbi:RNA exonuclease 1 homolog [Nyctibius grandis]|uniref:RNA exonuclease 1 homolog n=1 Tax=Nyctibius grandis TaxID=48427 RepID=UPI0035BBA9E6
MRPASCFGASFSPCHGAAGGGCQRPHCRYHPGASRRSEPLSAAPWPAAAGPSQGEDGGKDGPACPVPPRRLRGCGEGGRGARGPPCRGSRAPPVLGGWGVSLSRQHRYRLSVFSVTNEDENAKQQCKPMEVFPCENQDGNSKMSQFRSRSVFTKRSRYPSPVKLAIDLEDSDNECDLVIDVPPVAVNKKPRISQNCAKGNRDKELAAAVCAEKLHDSGRADVLESTEEESEKIVVLRKNSKSLNKYEKRGHISPKANEICLPDVNTDILKVSKERDALAYTAEKCISSATSLEVDMQKGILKQGNVETDMSVAAFVEVYTTNEDCVSSRRGAQSVLCARHSSKDETTIERPYKEIINKGESQSIEENGGNDNPEDTYQYPTYYLNKKESENTLLSSPAEEAEPSGEDTELSESDDPLEECRRIFDEFERETQKKDGDKQADGGNADLTLLETKVIVPGQKRRIAHTAKLDVHHNKNEIVPFKASPWQQGHDAEIQQAHWKAVKFAAAVKREQAFIPTTSKQKKTTPGLSAAQLQSIGPRDSLNLLAVQPIETSSGQLHVLLEGNVATAMPCGLSVLAKPGHSFTRTALVLCQVPTQKRPSIPESGSKVPLETRQRYVRLFYSECFKICSTVNEAVDKALIEEQSIYDRCGSKKMYLNLAVKALKKLRDHAFTGGALYELLKDYLLTEEQLNENNFPRPNPEKYGSAILTGVAKNPGYAAFKRLCCRCGEVYAVTSSGEHRRKEECNYHSGRVLEQKVPGGMEKRYSCCDRIVGSAGCQTAKLHVHDGKREKLEGFVKTLVKSPPFDGNYGVYALDCETCYTVHGLELTRVTVVDAKLQVVYDTFVKPDGKVVDYDTRLSGVTEDDLKNSTTSLRDVQAILLNLFSADTILIGHCLENDLLALKLIHDTVVDTSIVFPHRLGLPHKRTLRSLMADYLRRIRQDDVGGHNSREDAIACMELILWKVKEDNKRRK